MSHAQVPLLTKSAIHLAHLCALETWQGYSYSKGTLFNNVLYEHSPGANYKSSKGVQLSDEYLMSRFASHLLAIVKAKDFANTTPVSESLMDEFRNVAGIKSTERRGPKPDYSGGIDYFKKQVAEDYKSCLNASLEDKPYESVFATKNLSIALTHQNSDRIESEHIMLATRILFFVMPNIAVFNFSPEIEKFLSLKGDREDTIFIYQEKLWDGLKLNWSNLCEYDMPPPKAIDRKIYDLAKQSGWWQRRVFDLALKFLATKGNNIVISEKVKSAFLANAKII
jgi:hypothetical protein